MRRGRQSETADLERRIRQVLLGIVVVVSLVFMGLWRADNPRLTQLRTALIDAVSPGFDWAAEPVAFVTSMLRDFQGFIDVYAQNRELRREIEGLRALREKARALEEQNAQLAALMNVSLAPPLRFVTGDVIADSGGPFSESALVNVGLRDGVQDGAAAVDGNGLVGRAVGVGARATRLMLVTDFSSKVPVVIRPSGARAILAGDATSAPRLDFIDDPESVQPGDVVETSGEGGVFPPRLPVGRVIQSGGTLRAALAADFARLEFVRLLSYRVESDMAREGSVIVPARRRALDRVPDAQPPETGVPAGGVPAAGAPAAVVPAAGTAAAQPEG
ncbi:MAG: rod shape-determining protein MreC [Pseudomonadota bacterium]